MTLKASETSSPVGSAHLELIPREGQQVLVVEEGLDVREAVNDRQGVELPRQCKATLHPCGIELPGQVHDVVPWTILLQLKIMQSKKKLSVACV
jgi:hypothetical protein